MAAFASPQEARRLLAGIGLLLFPARRPGAAEDSRTISE
jgi:hypothetical protein